MMKRIVVLQTAFLGDLLLFIPLLKQIKKYWPEGEVTLVCKRGLGLIFIELGLCQKIIEVDKSTKQNYKKSISPLFLDSYDYLFCPHQSFRSMLLAKRIKAKIKIGFSNLWNFLIFNKCLPRNMLLPDALRQLSLLGLLQGEISHEISDYLKNRPKNIQLSDLRNRHIITDSQSMGMKRQILAHQQTQKVLHKFRIIPNSIFVAPGSVWNTKMWTEEGYRSLVQTLAQKTHVVLIGSSTEYDLCARIAKDLENVTNLAGQTNLFELLVLVTYGALLISNDSGAMHIASVAQTPTVAIFGPTVLDQGYQPWNNRSLIVENKNLNCRPCGPHGHRECPIGTHECMKSIGVEQVLQAIKDLEIIL